MKYLLIILLFIGCTKYDSDDTIASDEYKITVTQIKDMVQITCVPVVIKKYARIIEVVSIHEDERHRHTIYIGSDVTTAKTTYWTNKPLTRYYIVFFGTYSK
jgi:hypothetical protein